MNLDDCVSEIKPLKQEIITLRKHRKTIETILDKNAKALSIKKSKGFQEEFFLMIFH